MKYQVIRLCNSSNIRPKDETTSDIWCFSFWVRIFLFCSPHEFAHIWGGNCWVFQTKVPLEVWMGRRWSPAGSSGEGMAEERCLVQESVPLGSVFSCPEACVTSWFPKEVWPSVKRRPLWATSRCFSPQSWVWKRDWIWFLKSQTLNYCEDLVQQSVKMCSFLLETWGFVSIYISVVWKSRVGQQTWFHIRAVLWH